VRVTVVEFLVTDDAPIGCFDHPGFRFQIEARFAPVSLKVLD